MTSDDIKAGVRELAGRAPVAAPDLNEALRCLADGDLEGTFDALDGAAEDAEAREWEDGAASASWLRDQVDDLMAEIS